MSPLRQEVAALRSENTALREKLAARMKLDREWNTDLSEVVFSVAKNVSMLAQDNRERVLLAVAVLYGILKPGSPEQHAGEGGAKS